MFIQIGDSETIFHITKIEKGFLFLELCKREIQFARTGNKKTKINMGSWKEKIYISKKNKKEFEIKNRHNLADTVLISELEINLFSITKNLNGALIRNKRNTLILNYPDRK